MAQKTIHTKPLQYFQSGAPIWMSEEAIITLMRGYLQPDETPNQMYERLAGAAAAFYPNGIGDISQESLKASFLYAFLRGWLSPATPVATNFGTKTNFLPVSCFSAKIHNTIYDIFTALRETALLSKAGGGLGINLDEVRGITSVKDWGRFFDLMASVVSQGSSTRRGAVALYIDIEHPDIDAFLNAKDLLHGDVREKLDCNIAVMIKKSFMTKLREGDQRSHYLYCKVLELRMKFGSPYIQYMDNCWDQDPIWYKNAGMRCGGSNLCSEIMLFHDKDHTYACKLSSLNAEKYFEWKDFRFEGDINLPELSIYFLDAVCEEFIQKGSKIKGIENAVRGAVKGRPLGLGVLGLHNLYLQQSMPWLSLEAFALNHELFKFVNEGTVKASRNLAKYFGEPEWLTGYGMRNTHLTAVAPTTTNSVLANTSPGIEPNIAMYYAMAGAKGTFTRKNKYFEELLQSKGKDTGSVWSSIRKYNGSVQHLSFLSDHEKEVFKKADEICQFAIINQAAERQQFIDQGQSLNLFFSSNEDAQVIMDVHTEAESLGIKSLYYLRSDSQIQEVNREEGIDFVYLKTREDCIYCAKAKKLLEDQGIHYITEYKAEGRVPEIWVKGEKLKDGYNSLVKRFDTSGLVVSRASDCVSCEG